MVSTEKAAPVPTMTRGDGLESGHNTIQQCFFFKNPEELKQRLEMFYEGMVQWCSQARCHMHESKSKFIIFTTPSHSSMVQSSEFVSI